MYYTNMPEKSNIYKKIQDMRVELQSMKLKKSGKNTYSNFTYYELKDFLPIINELGKKHGVYSKFNIYRNNGDEKAVLLLRDIDSPDSVDVFESPTAEAFIGQKRNKQTGEIIKGSGADPIQNLGGKHKYMRRYLWMNAMEIEENDIVDAQGKKKVKNPTVIQKEIGSKEISYIKACKNLEDLESTYKRLLLELDSSYNESLIKHCTARKGELILQ